MHNFNSPDIIFKAIDYLVNSGQKDAASWVIKKLLLDFPEDARIHSEIAALEYEQGNMQIARGHFEKAVDLNPQNTNCLKALGDFYYVVEKDAQGALVQYEKVLALNENHLEALMMSGHVSVSMHRYGDARQYYQQVQKLDPSNSEIQQLLEKIPHQDYHQNTSAVSEDDLYADAQTKAQEGDRAAAISILEQLLVQNESHALAHNDLGVLQYENGNIQLALNHYEKAAVLQPENENFQKNLGDIYWAEMGDHQKALECYIQTLKLNPLDVEAQLGCGHICLAVGQADDAGDFFKNVLQIEPWNENARQLLGRIEQGQIANNFQSQTGDLGGGHPPAQTMEDDSQNAILSLKQQLAVSPQNAAAHNDLGILYFETGDKQHALQSYEQAVNLDPANATYSKNLADYYLIEQGRVEDAMKLYLRVLKNDPMDVESLIATGLICVSIGKDEDAKHFYNRVLEIEPWNETAQMALNNLQTGMAANSGNMIRTAASG